jgi:hypothetical protein
MEATHCLRPKLDGVAVIDMRAWTFGGVNTTAFPSHVTSVGNDISMKIAHDFGLSAVVLSRYSADDVIHRRYVLRA